jgi:MscS family membrane protein
MNDIKALLKTCPNIDQTRPIFVHVTRLASNSVECMVYCFTRYTEWGKFLETQQEVMLGILKVLEDNQASYGIPVYDLRIEHVNA